MVTRIRRRAALLAVSALAIAVILPAPIAWADNRRFNNAVVANIYQAQHQAGCRNNVAMNPALQRAAQRHTLDMLTDKALDGDIGSDNSTPRDRAVGAGFHGGKIAETVAINPALAISGTELLTMWFDNPAYRAIMQDCDYSQVGVWSENSLDRTVVVAVYGRPA